MLKCFSAWSQSWVQVLAHPCPAEGWEWGRTCGCGHNLCWEVTLQCKLSGARQSSLRAVRELQRAQLKQEISQQRKVYAVPTTEKRRYRAKNITDQSASLDFLSQIWRKYKLLTSQLILISSPKSGGTNQATCNHKKDINDSQHGSDNNKSRTVYFLL